MKTKFILLSIFLFFIFVTSNTRAQTTFNFSIKNMVNDSCMIGYYLGNNQYIYGDDGKNQIITIDKYGKGSFTRSDMKPGILLLVFPPENDYVDFVFEGDSLNFTLDRNDLGNTIKVNSLSNKLMSDYNILVMNLIQDHNELSKKKK